MEDRTGIDWAIVGGGGSGPKARPINKECALEIRDQCLAHGVAFFFKQWGGIHPKAGGCRFMQGMPPFPPKGRGARRKGYKEQSPLDMGSLSLLRAYPASNRSRGLFRFPEMPNRQARILILCKTYPSPSATYAETSCVAGMEESGTLIRLYPVPFRLIGDDKQFKKWQWVTVRIEKAKKDHRPESHKIFVDTINCDSQPLPTDDNWRARREYIEKIPVFRDFAELDAARKNQGTTLGLIRPSRVLGLDVTPSEKPEWTEEEKAKLIKMQQQGDLFDDTDARSIATLRKLPFDFHYRYACDVGDGTKEYRHKIVDWEAGALYLNVVRKSNGKTWLDRLKAKLESELPGRDLMFLMGNMHRFPHQWLIISLIFPLSCNQRRHIRDRCFSL